MTRTRKSILLVVSGLSLIVVHLVVGERPIDYTGPRALLDAGFALCLLCLVIFVAVGLGSQVRRKLTLNGLTLIEKIVIDTAIGLGIIGGLIFALGLIGLLEAWAFVFLIIVLMAFAWHESCHGLIETIQGVQSLFRARRMPTSGQRWLLLLSAVILILAVLQALTPAWDYDGLMYHLQAPKVFLQAGHIQLLPDTWQANGPASYDMLFMLGLRFGSDTFAKLLDLFSGVLLALSTFAFGRRFLKPNGGTLAAAILIGIPTISFWATWAYTDMIWAVYEFLAVYALVMWEDDQHDRWLVFAGLMTGMALSNKYLAVSGAALIVVWLLWDSRRTRFTQTIKRVTIFGAVALAIASPWYLKNWLLSGNPIYPLVFGGPGWDRSRLDALMQFLYSFGSQRGPLDYLLLPLRVYTDRSGGRGAIDWPSLLFPLALLYPLLHQSPRLGRFAAATGLRFVLWAFGSQQLRFLLPAFPGLSLLTASVLIAMTDRPRLNRLRSILTTGLAALMMCMALILSLWFIIVSRSWAVVFGFDSKDSFLRNNVGSYAAVRFIQSELSDQSRALLMWDGEGYYCDARCLPDAEQSRWTQAVVETYDVAAVTARLRSMGVTHLLYSMQNAEFIKGHDPVGQQRQAIDFFWQQYQPACARQLYSDKYNVLFEITCS